MPSGSHGGSSGSHSSGGSSSGGGSYRSSHHSSSSHRHGPTRIRWGGSYVMLSHKASNTLGNLRVAIIILIIFTCLVGIVLASRISAVRKIEMDQMYYLDMIEYAENNPEYIKPAEVTGKFFNPDVDKWYLTYTIMTEDNMELEGYTYSVYTLMEVSKYRIGDTIMCAVDSNPVTLSTDSINLEYKDIPLENDGEYVAARGERTTSIIIISALVGLIIILGISAFNEVKKAVKSATNEFSLSNPEKIENRCPYCGTKTKNTSSNCPNCGASFK